MKTIKLSPRDYEFLEAHITQKTELVKTEEQKKERIIEMMKEASRKYTKYAKKLGIIQKTPCEVCGDERSQAHHQDYSKPLEIKWLCQKHHKEEHKKNPIKMW